MDFNTDSVLFYMGGLILAGGILEQIRLGIPCGLIMMGVSMYMKKKNNNDNNKQQSNEQSM